MRVIIVAAIFLAYVTKSTTDLRPRLADGRPSRMHNYITEESHLAIRVGVTLTNNWRLGNGMYSGVFGGVVDVLCTRGSAEAQFAFVKIPMYENADSEFAPWMASQPKYVAVSKIKLRCGKGCCEVVGLPFKVGKTIMLHKSQGITVGE